MSVRIGRGSALRAATACLLTLTLLSAGCGPAYRTPDRGGPIPKVAPGDAGPGEEGGAPLSRNGDPATGITGMMGPGSAAIQIGNAVLVAWRDGGPAAPPNPAAAPPAPAGTPYTGRPAAPSLLTPGGEPFTANDLDNRIRSEYPAIRFVHLATDAGAAAELRSLAAELRGGRAAAEVAPRLLDLLRRVPSVSRPVDGTPAASPPSHLPGAYRPAPTPWAPDDRSPRDAAP